MPSGYQVFKFVMADFINENWKQELLHDAVVSYTATTASKSVNLKVVFENEQGGTTYFSFRVLPDAPVYVTGQLIHIPAHYIISPRSKKNKDSNDG